jgi:hypothetical protein
VSLPSRSPFGQFHQSFAPTDFPRPTKPSPWSIPRKKIAAEDIDSVVDIFRPYSCTGIGEFNAMSKRANDLYKARPASLGEPLSYQFVKKEVIGDTILRVTYFQRFKHAPLQWDFFFYKADNEWQIMNYSDNTSLVIMLSISVPPPARTPSSTPAADH